MFNTSDLTMSFGGGAPAVSGVSLTIEEHQIAAVIGPNGAGKTTLLNMMSGMLIPTSGSVSKQGRDLTKMSAHARCKRGLGRTFQQPSYFPKLAVVENVQTALSTAKETSWRMFGSSRTNWRTEALEILDLVGLAATADVLAERLPYGDQRRLEVAIALGSQPDLLLLDEPMAGMSARERRTLSELLITLNREQGLTLVFTEHDMDVVFSLSHVVHVLYQGRLLASGAPGEIQRHDEVQRIYLGRE